MFVFGDHEHSHHSMQAIVFLYGVRQVQELRARVLGHQNYIISIQNGKKKKKKKKRNLVDYSRLCVVYSRYIYFTATTCDDNIANHRMFVLENTNADPFQGSFTFKGQIHDPTNKWAIDGTAFQLPSGQLYFIWSGWEGDTAAPQFLYIAEMSNPWTISSDRIEISRPTYPWEKSGGAEINEGPEVTIRNGVISLVYSAAACWTDNYCLGLITASTNSNLMYPSSWHKHPNPIFQSANNVFGPGHHSFTISPDGKEDWIVYHSARYEGSGEVRQVRTQKFTWNADSTPNLGTPIDRNTPIPIPSGELMRIRYEAESARLINNPRIIPNNPTASNRTKVGYIDYANSVVELTIQCNRAGTYVILIRNANGTDGKPNSSHWLMINNATRIELPIVYSGWDMWGMVMIRANLVQGVNTLTIMKGANFAEIDEIDIFPYQS
mgnify:FL=1